MNKPLSIGTTKAGRAIFSRRKFMPGDTIGDISGDVHLHKDHESAHCIDLWNGKVLEPHKPFRFLNHSCEPNCELVIWELDEDTIERDNAISLCAIRPVNPGDELTIDYAWSADCAIPCLCGADGCRGWIVTRDELGQVLAR